MHHLRVQSSPVKSSPDESAAIDSKSSLNVYSVYFYIYILNKVLAGIAIVYY